MGRKTVDILFQSIKIRLILKTMRKVNITLTTYSSSVYYPNSSTILHHLFYLQTLFNMKAPSTSLLAFLLLLLSISAAAVPTELEEGTDEPSVQNATVFKHELKQVR
jgi:hypothetical protein